LHGLGEEMAQEKVLEAQTSQDAQKDTLATQVKGPPKA